MRLLTIGRRSRASAVAAVVVVAACCGLAAPMAKAGGAPASSSSGATKPYLADVVPRARGCIVLSPVWAGVKVYLVQRRLGTTSERERYGPQTAKAVREFQRRRGLAVTGKVNRQTWRELGIDRPFCLDRFTVQPQVTLAASRRARVDAMVTWATAQVGRRYVWSGAGKLGYDCSGLALQALHAGGLVLPTVTTWRHQHSAFPTAAAIADSGLRRLALTERRRGDLVFWGPAGADQISHMAIYLGNGRVVEAVRPTVHIASLWSHDVPIKPYVVRPF